MSIRNFWGDHKRKILIAGGIIIGGTVIIVLARKGRKIPKIVAETIVENDFSWAFDNIEDAVQKFKEIETACVTLGKGEVAMFGGVPGEITVMYL